MRRGDWKEEKDTENMSYNGLNCRRKQRSKAVILHWNHQMPLNGWLSKDGRTHDREVDKEKACCVTDALKTSPILAFTRILMRN